MTDPSFAEMITGYPLFRGRDNNDQLVQIMKIVGTPSDATLQQIKMNSVGVSLDRKKTNLSPRSSSSSRSASTPSSLCTRSSPRPHERVRL
jgi:hypothetical protein